MILINWWLLNKDEILHLSETFIKIITKKIKTKSKNFNKFRIKIGLGREIYQSLVYRKQGISVKALVKILQELDIPLKNASKEIIAIGRYKCAQNLKFPISVTPQWAELLAHAFFDGYADKYIMKYSNYDANTRKEFVDLVRNIFDEKVRINCPKSYLRDINLPSIVPRLLTKFFNVQTFYSKKCRIPTQIFQLTKSDKKFGYYFLKGAFIDEGSITGGQIWIVRGIGNKFLADDIVKLCSILGIKTRVQRSIKNKEYFSVGVCSESFERFYTNVRDLFFNKNYKLSKIETMMIKRSIPLTRGKDGRFERRPTWIAA